MKRLIIALLGISPMLAYSSSVEFGANSAWGPMYSGQLGVNDLYNPASGAAIRNQQSSQKSVQAAINVEGGVEYGNIDDLFQLIDDLQLHLEGSGNNSGGSDNDSSGGDSGIDLPDLDLPDIDIGDIDLDGILEGVEANVLGVAGALVIVATEGYTTLDAGMEAPILFNRDIWGGTLAVEFGAKQYAGAVGIAQPIDFDREQARQELERLRSLGPDSPETTFDLSGGIYFTVDPSAGSTDLAIDNDSALLTKGVRKYEVRAAYSRLVSEYAYGDLYVGVEPALIHMGRSNLAIRIGDILDAKGLFDDVNDAEYQYNTGFTADIGALWLAKHYRLGVDVKNVYEPTFNYPQMDLSRISNEMVLKTLNASREFKLERQLTLESGIHTEDYRWSTSFSIDANAVIDPLYNLNQWVHLSTGYQPKSRWLPSVRAGYHENLKGTRLRFAGVGATFFDIVSLDLGMALDKTTVSGEEYTKGLKLNFGFKYWL